MFIHYVSSVSLHKLMSSSERHGFFVLNCRDKTPQFGWRLEKPSQQFSYITKNQQCYLVTLDYQCLPLDIKKIQTREVKDYHLKFVKQVYSC